MGARMRIVAGIAIGFYCAIATACSLLPPAIQSPVRSGDTAAVAEKAPAPTTGVKAGTATKANTATKPAASTPAVVAPAVANSDTLKTLRELREAASTAFDSSHPVEALRHLVGLLAIHESAAAETDAVRATERAELVRKAETELTAIGARFVLEPTDEWIVDGTQTAGSTRALAKGEGLRPSVRLVVNYDFGKAVVADAPLRFGFMDGIGEITDAVTTDSFGVAAATVRSLARTDQSAVIRAILVISNRGKTKAFTEVFRDFTFLPPSRSARVLALERAQSQVVPAADHSPLIDAVARALAGSGLELLPMEGAMDPAAFIAALGGDPVAVKAALTAGGRNAAYLVAALSEYDEPRQMVNQGKTYEIYTSNVRTTVRLLRADGSVLLSRPEVAVRGQAGTPAGAIQAGLKAARDAVEKDLASAAATIQKALD